MRSTSIQEMTTKVNHPSHNKPIMNSKMITKSTNIAIRLEMWLKLNKKQMENLFNKLATI